MHYNFRDLEIALLYMAVISVYFDLVKTLEN